MLNSRLTVVFIWLSLRAGEIEKSFGVLSAQYSGGISADGGDDPLATDVLKPALGVSAGPAGGGGEGRPHTPRVGWPGRRRPRREIRQSQRGRRQKQEAPQEVPTNMTHEAMYRMRPRRACRAFACSM